MNTDRRPWLVLLHGFGLNASYFKPQIAALEDDYRLLPLELRGHGHHARQPGPFGLEEYADDIEKTLADKKIIQARFWGSHTGAAVGLLLANRQPQLFSGLVLESGFLPGFDMPHARTLHLQSRTLALTHGVQAARDDWLGKADWFRYLHAHPKRCRADAFDSMAREFDGAPWLSPFQPRKLTQLAGRLLLIRQPVLLYHGAEEIDDLKRASQFLAANLPNARLAEIPDAGSFPAWENPAGTGRFVLDFLARLE
ncbi:alpha/beta fold hydrolase [Chitinilyticum aquatile]|uniref:alpha/beta fold hydrolase n=1 Tax=Chitinilyticum aquatile TaxID=362520 RepID=UPI000414B97C|nr:alpha/beta fold hydrolase [Chitinilyticum aquatile]